MVHIFLLEKEIQDCKGLFSEACVFHSFNSDNLTLYTQIISSHESYTTTFLNLKSPHVWKL